MFREPVEDMNELKQRIRDVIQTITGRMLENTWRELQRRIEWLAENGGGHKEVYRR